MNEWGYKMTVLRKCNKTTIIQSIYLNSIQYIHYQFVTVFIYSFDIILYKAVKLIQNDFI